MNKWNEFFRRQSPRLNFTIGALLLALMWRLDLLTSTQVSMSILYLIPIGFVAWFCGSPWSYLMALLAAAAWLHVDIELNHPSSHWIIPYWNAAVRLGFFLIVTALAGLTQRLRRLNDVERESSQLKSDMMDLVTHEFGNSLTTLRLALALVRESEGDGSEVERADHCDVMERVIAHLSAATANFLNLNRLEAGRFRPQFSRTPLRMVIHEALALLEPIIERKKISLRLEFPSEGIPVRADPDALSIVMTNLIGNAFKYTPDGGAVTIRILIERLSPATASVSIKDTGIGIAPGDRKKILSGDYRTNEARRVAKGYGVGLRVVSDLLLSMGSELGVDSELGKGSRFYFRMPLWEEAAARIL